MKKTIRQGVFETNSSSTHSLTIKKVDGVKDEASFEIRSSLAKMKWIIGHINHAEEEMKERLLVEFDGKSLDDIKKELILKAQLALEADPANEVYLLEDNDNLENYSFSDLDGFLSYADDKYSSYSYNHDIVFEAHAREKVLKLKDLFIDAYCQMKNISVEEAWNEFNPNCETCHLSCDDFFQEGPMDGCPCGFSSFIELDKQLSKFDTIQKIQRFLSDEYTIIAKESINFMSAYISNKIY